MSNQSQGGGDSVKVTCDACGSQNVVPARALNHKVRCAKCGEVFRAVSTTSDAAEDQENGDWFSAYMQGDTAPDPLPQPKSKSNPRHQRKVATKASGQDKPHSAFLLPVIVIVVGIVLCLAGLAQADRADSKLSKPVDLRIKDLVENGIGNESYVRLLGARLTNFVVYEGQENQALQIITGRVWRPATANGGRDQEIVLVAEKEVEGQLVDTLGYSSGGSWPLTGVLSQGDLDSEALRLIQSENPSINANNVYVLRMGRPRFTPGIMFGLGLALAGVVVALVGLNQLRKAAFKKS